MISWPGKKTENEIGRMKKKKQKKKKACIKIQEVLTKTAKHCWEKQ